jgi:hypothetical protein
MWKKLPWKVRVYGMTPRPAGPMVAPSGSSDAAASVGETGAASSVLGAEGAADDPEPLSACSWMSWNFTCERLAILLSWTSSDGVSSSPGTALPSETNCW